MKNKIEARPQPAQLEAIRRLVGQGQLDSARTRLLALRRQFPQFKPLLALAWELARESGNQVEAACAALDWSRASPGSALAWQALGDSAGTEFPALSVSALRRGDELAGKAVGDEPEAESTPFGPLTFQDSVRMDVCRIMLSAGRLDEAEAAVADLSHVSARNNLALVHFAKGDVARALAILEDNWQQAPNLFALGRLVRLRLWTGGLDSAAGLASDLFQAEAHRGEDRLGQVEGLVLLGRLEEAEEIWLRNDAAHEDTDGRPGEFPYLGAYLAWRLGKEELALERLLQDPDSYEAQNMVQDFALAKLTRGTPDWSVGEWAAWWPLSNINRARKEAKTDADVLAVMSMLKPHNDYLMRMIELGGKVCRTIALPLLQDRASHGDEGASAALTALLDRPCGPDAVRTGLQSWLVDQGLLARGALLPMWLKGESREIRTRAFRIVTEPTTESDLPPEDQTRYVRAFGLYGEARLGEAEAEMAVLLGRHPDHPRVLANLAIARHGLDLPLADFEPLARRAFAVDPNYAFARIAMALVLIKQGEPKEALVLLDPIVERDELHITEWQACLGVQLFAARAMGDSAAVSNIRPLLREAESMAKG